MILYLDVFGSAFWVWLSVFCVAGVAGVLCAFVLFCHFARCIVELAWSLSFFLSFFIAASSHYFNKEALITLSLHAIWKEKTRKEKDTRTSSIEMSYKISMTSRAAWRLPESSCGA